MINGGRSEVVAAEAAPSARWRTAQVRAPNLNAFPQDSVVQPAMEKSKNFRIDALLADEANRCSQDLSADSPVESQVSCRRAGTPSPRPTQLQTGIIPKPSVLGLPHPGIAAMSQSAIPGIYHAPIYPLSALGGQHPALAYTGFAQLTQTYPEHLKAAAMAAPLPLEHWIRAGIMMPRMPDYSCKYDHRRSVHSSSLQSFSTHALSKQEIVLLFWNNFIFKTFENTIIIY